MGKPPRPVTEVGSDRVGLHCKWILNEGPLAERCGGRPGGDPELWVVQREVIRSEELKLLKRKCKVRAV